MLSSLKRDFNFINIGWSDVMLCRPSAWNASIGPQSKNKPGMLWGENAPHQSETIGLSNCEIPRRALDTQRELLLNTRRDSNTTLLASRYERVSAGKLLTYRLRRYDVHKPRREEDETHRKWHPRHVLCKRVFGEISIQPYSTWNTTTTIIVTHIHRETH